MKFIYAAIEAITLAMVEYTLKDMATSKFKAEITKIMWKIFFVIMFFITYAFILGLILIYFAKRVI